MRRRLTKDEFLKVYEREMKEKNLVPLTKDFYRRVLASLSMKGEKESLKAEVEFLESDAIREMLAEMFLCRIIKIVGIIITTGKVDLSQLTDEEIEVLGKINNILDKFKKCKEVLVKEITPQNVLVIFTKSHPPFLASDRKMYGPFSKGDVAYLPIVDVTDLKDKGVVTIIKE